MDDTSPDDISELPRIRFIDNEIDLCGTFLDVARVEADDPPQALLARSNAQQGYEFAMSWIKSIRNLRERDRLMNKLFNIRKRLDDLDQSGPGSTGTEQA